MEKELQIEKLTENDLYKELMHHLPKPRRRMTSFRIISLSFICLIAVGVILLMLPISKAGPGGATFMEALFTATSASCVTGLVVQNTATFWTPFGQAVILCLIQVGGLGVVTMAVAISMVTGKKIGLFQRSAMQDAISTHTVGGVVKMTGFILKVTAVSELIGAIALSFQFIPQYGVKGIWYSVFHSISAFCNAGFDLLGINQNFCSLCDYPFNPLVNVVLILLIVWGGLSFMTWDDIRQHKFKLRRYRLQSKLILAVSAVLIILPMIYFYALEFNRPVWGDLSTSQRIWASLFQSVTTRTAGFNTMDLSLLSGGSLILFLFLMIIGGSPGSTAGGLKTTTIGVLFISAFATFRNKDDINLFGRRIPEEAIRSASSLMIYYLTMFLGGGIAISVIEDLPILTCLFETASAVGTVGLTLGITPGLHTASRIILIVLMFLGRIGGLTLAFAVLSKAGIGQPRYAKEKISVG